MKKRMIGISANGKKFLLNVKEEDGKIIAGTDFQEPTSNSKLYYDSFTGEKFFADENRIADAKADIENHIDIPANESENVENEFLTLRAQFENYIRSQKGILSDATLKIYENVKNKHLQKLMNMNAMDITESDISAAMEEELANGVSPTTVKKYRQILKKVLAPLIN